MDAGEENILMEEKIKEDLSGEMSVFQTREYLESLRTYGVVPGLDSIRRLCARLGNPQDDLRFVHIAGTNGKGSVLCLIAAALEEAGYRTGCYSSPAVLDEREIIKVNGRMISRKGFCQGISRIRTACIGLTQEGFPHPTLFEVQTALAFWYFKEKKCDIVVLETGMGGELDATNVVKTTAAAVFAPVSPDHMGVLGNSLAEIARTKSGIVKPGCRAVTARQKPEVLEMIEERCRSENVALTVAEPDAVQAVKSTLQKQVFSYKEKKKLEITLAGRYELENAVLALEALEVLAGCGYPVPDTALRRGFLKAVWPGRFQVIKEAPVFIADGAHNIDAAIKLEDSLRFYFGEKKLIYIMGMLRDKDHEAVIRSTCPSAGHILTVSTQGERGLSAYELAGKVRKYHGEVTALDSVEEAVEIGLMLSGGEIPVIAFGSLSYLGKLINIVQNRKKKKK